LFFGGFVAQTEAAARKSAFKRIDVFEYPPGPNAPAPPEWGGWAEDKEAVPKSLELPADDGGAGALEARIRAEFEKRLSEETHRSFESGRERGRQEGRQLEHEAQAAAHAAAEQERMQQAARLIESFTQARENFLQEVEHEVVKLALAVAARILRREAQMDPLLLTGAVRVALGQLSGSTQVRLRVPPADLDLWSEAIALLPHLAVKPMVLAGEGMRLGDCTIETELGTVDLGIRAQLGEIERGFFDRAGGVRADRARADAAERVGAASDTDRGCRE
jgi:flagellar assembly protein FliH